MFFKNKKVIGLDIGTSSIKIAEMVRSGSFFKLVSFSMLPTPPEAVLAGEIVDQEKVASAITSMLMNLKNKTKAASIGVAGSSVIVKKIMIPAIEDKMMEDQVRWEAEQYIPFDLKEITLTHSVLKSTKSSQNVEILLIAAQNEFINKYKETILRAGLTCDIIDLSSFAFSNIYQANYGRSPRKTIGLLNIGAGVTSFVVIDRGEIVFSRDIPIGGNYYTQEIQKEMNVTLKEAELFKLSTSKKGEVPDEVHSILSVCNDFVSEEIRHSFDFYSATSTGAPITQVYFAGGASQTPGLIQQIEKHIGIPLKAMDPFIRVQNGNASITVPYLQQIAPYASVALGLAMREVGDSDKN